MGLLTFINALSYRQQTAPTERNLVSVAALDPIEADYGTAFEDLDLPASVMGTFNSGSPSLVALEWLEGDYNPLDGVYTLFANIVEDGFTNEGNVQAEIEVEVLDEVPAAITPIDPTTKTMAVWIDAEDYSVGTFANGASLTNKGNAAITFTVVGTTLAIQVNADGKKEFVFDGNSVIQCQSVISDFTKYKNGTTSFTTLFIGKIGTTSNPDAFYGVCGNNGGTSLAHGHYMAFDNRVSQAPNNGIRFALTKNVAGSMAINGIAGDPNYNSRQSFYVNLNLGELIDLVRTYSRGNLIGVTDRPRTTANTTSSLGAAVAFQGTAPTHKFEIGSVGNGLTKLVGKMEQFILFDENLDINDVRGIDTYFDVPIIRGDSKFKYLHELDVITSQYVLGGLYVKNADRSKTIWLASRGPDHFAPGSDRQGVQAISTDDGFTWPSSYTVVFDDAAQAVHGGISGAYTPTGRLVVAYGRYSATTGAYNALITRYSDDDGATWSAEATITIPTTSPALTAYVFHERMEVEDNGDLVAMCYATSTTALYKLYVFRSTDNGANWTPIEVFSSGSEYINESSIVNMKNGYHLIHTRVEPTAAGFYEFRQFISGDNLATFTNQGDTTEGLNYVYAHPPMLRMVLISGVWVVERSWVNRGTRRWHFKYALPDALVANGPSEWNSKTLYTFDQRRQGPTGGYESGYPYIMHPDDRLKSEGTWSEEASNSVTNVAFFKIDDEHKWKIKLELSI